MAHNEMIYSCNLTGYRPIIWLGEAVIRRENQIRSVLKEKLGEEYAELFSRTKIISGATPAQTTATWATSYGGKFVSFNKLSIEEKQAAKQKLTSLVAGINGFCSELRNMAEPEQHELAEIIELALRLPSESFIMSNGDKVVLVMWGFINDASDFKGIELSKFLGYIFPTLIPQEAHNVVENVKKEPVNNAVPNTTPIVESVLTPPPAEKKKRRFRWWWILIFAGILMILLLLFFLIRGCQRQALPDNPGVVPPIDTTQIITNPGDTMQRPVVGNRLNIILDKNTDIRQFASDFNSKFGSDARIIYYDTIIKQLQIEFYVDDIPTWKKRVREIPGVRIVFEESIFHSNYSPSDPAFRSAANAYYFSSIKVYGAWDKSKGSKDIRIAIIDDGFDLTHPEFQGRVIDPWNVVENSPNVGTYGGACVHGTHVACLSIGNIDNSAGASGIAPECSLIPIQIADANGNMSSTAIINGILYAINKGANVINLSLGMIFPPFVRLLSVAEQQQLANTLYPEEEAFWEELYNYASDYNVVIVQAAGNNDVLSAIDPMKRSDKTIVVAASDAIDAKADFSNYGSRTDVSAPGSQIFSAIPGSKYALMDGTSMASPIVAGACGLLLSLNKTLRPVDIKRILEETGVTVVSPLGKTVGPLIQLDKAAEMAAVYRPMSCEEMVDSLLSVIMELRKKVCDSSDKLIFPENPVDCKFTEGKWISTSSLVNSNTDIPVQLIFDFTDNCTGNLTFAEKGGKKCFAALTLSITGKKLIIDQQEEATCSDNSTYYKYIFECVPDADGVAQCSGRPVGARLKVVSFTLNRL